MKSLKVLTLCLIAAIAAPFGATARKIKKQVQVKPTASAPAPEWMDSAVIYEVNLRQGTPEGTLKAMQRQIPRLKDLGVDILWLMPVHPISEVNRKGTLGSYYAVRDYKGVNPEFGTIEDIKEFVRTAHAHGLKVIIDEVCNHTGCDNEWLTTHPEYYARDAKGNLISPFDWTDTYKLDYSNPATVEAMTDALLFWVKEVDVDGFRCDVAGEVPTAFWEKAVPQLRAVKPIFMLAEASKPELLNKAFNADYAWPMKDVFNAIAANKGVNSWAVAKKQDLPKLTGADIFAKLDQLNAEYPTGAVHMNMVTNHDLNSWEGTEFDRFGPATGTFAVLSYTLPGMPMMYTGQECGLNHAFEFFEKDPVAPSYVSNQITTFYEMLNSLKHNHPALNASNTQITRLDAGNPDIVAFSRTSGDDTVIVIANLSGEKVPVNITDAPRTCCMTNYFTGAPAAIPSALDAWQYVVLTK